MKHQEHTQHIKLTIIRSLVIKQVIIFDKYTFQQRVLVAFGDCEYEGTGDCDDEGFGWDDGLCGDALVAVDEGRDLDVGVD